MFDSSKLDAIDSVLSTVNSLLHTAIRHDLVDLTNEAESTAICLLDTLCDVIGCEEDEEDDESDYCDCDYCCAPTVNLDVAIDDDGSGEGAGDE